jgi:hypothetical protein
MCGAAASSGNGTPLDTRPHFRHGNIGRVIWFERRSRLKVVVVPAIFPWGNRKIGVFYADSNFRNKRIDIIPFIQNEILIILFPALVFALDFASGLAYT